MHAGAGVDDRWSRVLSRGEGATLSWRYYQAQAETPARAGIVSCILLIEKVVFCRFYGNFGVRIRLRQYQHRLGGGVSGTA